MEGHWDIVISSLQDICNSNEATSFDNIYEKRKAELPLTKEELLKLQQDIIEHKTNIETAQRLIETCQQNLQLLIKNTRTRNHSATDNQIDKHIDGKAIPKVSGKNGSKSSSKGSNVNISKKKNGRLFYVSKYSPNEPVVIGSEVAYKLKNRPAEEWIQCEVTKVLGDGIKFEIRDPEPDENNNPGQTFKANYKEIILISNHDKLMNYPYRFKVLARYPETTTFYPAVVMGTKKDGKVRLKFDGEEEANKETEVERRLVLPFPEK